MPTSREFLSGIINFFPALWVAKANGRAPGKDLNLPDNASSPANSYWLKSSSGICPVAAKIPIAIGKSNLQPSLGKSAGAKFTVTLLLGKRSYYLK